MPATTASIDVVCGDAIADSQPVSVRQYTSGRIINRSGGNLVLTMYECERIDGTYVVAADAGSIGDVTVNDARSAALPSALARANYIKLLRDTGDDATVTLVLKD